MPLFEIPEGGPDHLREDPTLGSFDISGEEELFALNDRAIASHEQVVAHIQRVNAWIEAEGIENLLRERLKRAQQKAASDGMRMGLQRLLGGEPSDSMKDFLLKQHPGLIATNCGNLGHVYAEAIRKLNEAADYGDIILPDEIRAQMRRTAIELAKTSALHSIAYNALFERFLELVEHGLPEWDADNGCELPLESGIPTMGSSSNEPTLSTSTSVDDIADRILSQVMPSLDKHAHRRMNDLFNDAQRSLFD